MRKKGVNDITIAKDLAKRELQTNSFRLEMDLEAEESVLSIKMDSYIEGKMFDKFFKAGEGGLNHRTVEDLFEIFGEICEEVNAKQQERYIFGKKLPYEGSQNYLKINPDGIVEFQWIFTIGKKREEVHKIFSLDFAGNIQRGIEQKEVTALKQKCEELQKENVDLKIRIEKQEEKMSQIQQIVYDMRRKARKQKENSEKMMLAFKKTEQRLAKLEEDNQRMEQEIKEAKEEIQRLQEQTNTEENEQNQSYNDWEQMRRMQEDQMWENARRRQEQMQEGNQNW